MTPYRRFTIFLFKMFGIVGGVISALMFALSLADVLFGLNAGFGLGGVLVTAFVFIFCIFWFKLGRFIEREVSDRS